MRLGYLALEALKKDKDEGFNEAEAHAPRIRGLGCGVGGVEKGFNEAEAHAPRIHSPKRRARHSQRRASMRPRRMRLGYLCLVERARLTTARLQ